MNGLDVAIVIGSVCAFVGGYRRGLIARVVMWVCVVVTMLLAAENMAQLVGLFHRSEGRPQARQVVVVVVGSLVLGRVLGAIAGHWVRRRIPTRPLRFVDRAAGGAAGVAGVAITLWLATPVLAFLPGWPSGAVRSSVLATTLSRRVPVRLDAFSAVRNLLHNGGFPIVVSEIGPSIDAGSPPAQEVLDSETRRRVQSSVVRVSSVGCGGESIGTGFVVGGGRILTAAHVVAGAKAISVASGSKVFPVRVVSFDSEKDLALLEAPHPRVGSPLALGRGDIATESGFEGEVLGYLDGGPLRNRSIRSSAALREEGRDIFDEREVTREVLRLAADLGPGDSGAPVFDDRGTVRALVFSRAPDRTTTAFALAASELRRFLVGVPGTMSAKRCLPLSTEQIGTRGPTDSSRVGGYSKK